ncbi:MAG TPA: O-antigen ligase family protein [Candidatus Omnitrophota bacterium]|nr:O-antigen ligase family protein [Candidatus Omnitrophota bacterium]HRZ14108.1 O-antigen ligase family protein [Candidatus Omnitrophota bacterium]
MHRALSLVVLSVSLFLFFSVLMLFNELNFVVLISSFFIIGFIALLFLNLKLGLLYYLFIRSFLDVFSKSGISFGVGAENLASYMTVAVIIVSIFFLLFKKINIFKIRSFRLLICFIAFCSFSSIFSIKPVISFIDLLRFVGLLMIGLISFHLFDKSELRKIFISFVGATILPIFFSIWQIGKDVGIVDAGFKRIYGTFVHPNMFAFFLLTIMIVLIVNLVYNKFKINSAFNLILLLIYSIFLLLTFTRAAWLAAILGCAILAVLVREYRFKILGALILIILLFSPLIIQRFADVGHGRTHGYYTDSWTWRVKTWNEGLPLFYEHPVMGVGLGMFPEMKSVYAHNDYVRLLVETGLPGCILYILIYISLAIGNYKVFRNSSDDIVRQFSLTVTILSCLYLLVSFSDNLSRSASTLTYFIVIVALAEKCQTNSCVVSSKRIHNETL